jgi:hypothetical protein
MSAPNLRFYRDRWGQTAFAPELPPPVPGTHFGSVGSTIAHPDLASRVRLVGAQIEFAAYQRGHSDGHEKGRIDGFNKGYALGLTNGGTIAWRDAERLYTRIG